MTAQQIKNLHALLNATRLTAQKAELVSGVTEGRTESSRELADAEYIKLMAVLCALPQEKKQHKPNELTPLIQNAFYHFRKMGFITNGDKPDYDRINAFTIERTAAKKKLSQMDKAELTATITQLKTIVKKWKA